MRSTPRSARTRRRATSRSSWRSPPCRRCSTGPATSTARATAAALLLDIPRKIWAEEVRSGGHDPSLALDDAFAVAHVFIERSQDRREDPARRPRAARPRAASGSSPSAIGVVDSPALGPTAREEEPHFWQIAGLVPDADRRDRVLFELADRAREASSTSTSPSFSATTCVYKVMGAPERARRLLPGPARRALRDDRLLRPQPLLDQHLALVQARAAVLGPRPQRRDQHDRAAAPGGADARRSPIQPDASDSQDLNRTIDTLVSREGLSLAEAMEMVVPPIVDEIRAPARGAARLLHVPAPGDGAVRPGPGRADRPPRRRVRVLGRRARPAPAVAGRDRATTSSSAPSPASSRSHDDGLRAEAARPGREGDGHDRPRQARARPCTPHDEMQRIVRDRWLRAQRRRRGRRLRPRPGDRRPARGRRTSPATPTPGPTEPVKVDDRVLAGFGWQRDDVKLVQQMASNGAEPIGSLGYDGPLAALSPERQNLADYFKETVAVVTNPAIDREREIEHFSTRAVFGRRPSIDDAGRGHRHGRDRVPGPARRPPRPGAALRHRPTARSPASTSTYLLEDLWEEFRGRAAARRHLAARVGDDRRARSSGSSRRR